MPRDHAGALSEPQFAALVDALAADPERRDELLDLLREDHALYDQRGAATIVRMRGWVLLALARAGVSDAALLSCSRSSTPASIRIWSRRRRARCAPTRGPARRSRRSCMRALANIRYRDEPVSFEDYGDYAVSATGTSAVRELLATLAWLGPHAQRRRPAARGPARRRAGFRPSCGATSGGRCRPSVTPRHARRRRAARSRAAAPRLRWPTCCGSAAGRSTRSCWRITQATRSASRRSSAASPRSSCSSTRAATIR